MTITVKDCPFCGAENIEIDEVGTAEYAVTCQECRAIGPILGDVMEAINTWNTRRKEPLHNTAEAA